ncbi:endothelin-converting enzyme 1 [Monomorium pharaonis]|uniref:endothelin-converting enzyme 1 n=1 Tax=Monomorium pharaonis TaxID=307658 RepID=UPI00063F4619|nr:endothelin-converting enzyme 1 [Monomorium pharaonis]
MRQFILVAFIGVLLMKNATSSKNQRHPSNLAWFSLNNKSNENKEENKEESMDENRPIVCQTQECKKIAQRISENMDKSMDPCDDFYEYACGKWSEHNTIPEGMDSWNMIHSTQKNIMEQVEKIFNDGPKNDDLLAIKLAKKWYTVCMDTDTMDRQGLEPLVFTLSRIGGWPMIMEPDEWNEQEYSWQKVDDQYMRLMGRNAFHDVRLMDIYTWNNSRSLRPVAHIDVPHLPPASFKIWIEIDDNEEERDKSDEDPSDEEKQSDEQKDSQEPGSEDEDHKKTNNNSNNDNNDNNDNDDNDDNGNYDNHDSDVNEDNDNDGNRNEQNNNKNAKKVSMKKPGKFIKNKKVRHSRKIKSNTHSKKNENYKLNHKKERIKRQAIPENVCEKLHAWKNKMHHMKQARKEKLKKTLEMTTRPQITTEEPIDEDDYAKQYTNYISKVGHAIAKARGVEVSEEHMNKDIQDMIKFQAKLFEITTDPGQDKDMTLNDFQKWYNKKKPKTVNSVINWIYKIGKLFDEAQVHVDGNLNLRIRSPNYFANLAVLLDETSSRTIVNYIHWNFLSRIIRTTTSEMKKLYFAWEDKQKNNDTKIFGVSVRWFKCTQEVEMSDILSYEYVRNHFSDEITTTALDMMDDIQKEMEYQIKESDWMDENAKNIILAKLVNMKKTVGYPEWYKNNTIVKQYYQGLIIGNSYYENTLSYNRYTKWKGLRRLIKKKNDKNDKMRIIPIRVNAGFSSYSNSIELSAAIFQSPFFAYDRPRAINYGIVGTIIGHEVNHGFDDDGYEYDKNGNIVEWSPAMAEAFGKKRECFVEQFNNYSILKKSIYIIKDYGNQTAGDNIADTMGLEAAFRAYQRREREYGKTNTVLLGQENITNDQLFFLSYANIWCDAETNGTLDKAKSDEHSTSRLRVIGTLSNSVDFAKAYNCPLGSAMNPEKKCHIWK